MRLDYKADKEDWKRAARAIRGTIFGATRDAFTDLASQIQRQGRSEIARAGFSLRWQRAFRTYVFPRRPNFTTDLVVRGQHRIGYANIFERGGTIPGRPLLWVPLPTAPKRILGKEVTAARMIAAGVRLFRINRPGRAPLLAGYTMGRGKSGRVTVGQLRTGQRNVRRRQVRQAFGAKLGARPRAVPLFVGLKSSRIGDRLNVSAIYDRARADLPRVYAKRIRELLD